MKTLDLYRIWEILNFISEQENVLNDKNIYPCFLGMNSSYCEMYFDSFINYYSFRIDEDEICIFNNDPIPYEDYNNEDYSYIPNEILFFNDEQLIGWVNDEVAKHLVKEEENKKLEKKELEDKIKLLTQRLEKL